MFSRPNGEVFTALSVSGLICLSVVVAMETFVVGCSSSLRVRSSLMSESQSVVPLHTEVVCSMLCEVLILVLVVSLVIEVVCSMWREVLGTQTGVGCRLIFSSDCFNINGW